MNSEDPDFTAALLGFNGEAVLYCQGISESLAHDYALDYWRMIGDRTAIMGESSDSLIWQWVLSTTVTCCG